MADATFDELIHAPQRLRICGALAGASYVEFSELQARLALSKSALSKHVSQLVDAAYVEESHITRNGRARLRLSLTHTGQLAYRRHIAALKEITADE